jgi:hypothetical protein
MSNQIISLSSFGSGVGKSYVANLFTKHGFMHFSWASYLRYFVAKYHFDNCPEHYLHSAGHIEPDKEWEQESGFDNALIYYSKQNNNREKVFDKNCEILQGMVKESPVIISDTRFPFEVEFLTKNFDAWMVRVDGKPDRGYKEYDLLLTDFDFDMIIDNSAKDNSIIDTVKYIVDLICDPINDCY